MIKQKNKYKKSEEYYTKSIQNNDIRAYLTLSILYFYQAIEKEKSLKYIIKSYTNKATILNTYFLAIIELWTENFSRSYEKFLEFLSYVDLTPVSEYITLLISKGQLYKAKEFLEMPEYQLKERYKPIWYALMTLMQDDFPHEIKKMGSELQGTVDEVLEEIERLKVKYTLPA